MLMDCKTIFSASTLSVEGSTINTSSSSVYAEDNNRDVVEEKYDDNEGQNVVIFDSIETAESH